MRYGQIGFSLFHGLFIFLPEESSEGEEEVAGVAPHGGEDWDEAGGAGGDEDSEASGADFYAEGGGEGDGFAVDMDGRGLGGGAGDAEFVGAEGVDAAVLVEESGDEFGSEAYVF